MGGMFTTANTFNSDLSGWDVSSVTLMQGMFRGATTFDSDLSSWNVSSVRNMLQMLDNSGLSQANYDATLSGWSALTLQNGVELGADGLEYCTAQTDRQSIIDTYNWDITGDSFNCSAIAFITTWKTDNTGTSNDDQITIPTTGSGYN